MNIQKLISLNIIAGSLLVSASCSAKPSQSSQINVKTTAPHHHSANNVKSSKPHNYLKPGAGISYTHNLPKDLAPGETAVFQLTLDESYEAGIMSVDIRGEGDVQVFPSSSRASFDMSAANTHVTDVSVTVGSSGRHYLNVRALAKTANGQSMPRIFSIPVQSGPVKAMKMHDNMQKTATGENIIVMEAQEVIQ